MYNMSLSFHHTIVTTGALFAMMNTLDDCNNLTAHCTVIIELQQLRFHRRCTTNIKNTFWSQISWLCLISSALATIETNTTLMFDEVENKTIPIFCGWFA